MLAAAAKWLEHDLAARLGLADRVFIIILITMMMLMLVMMMMVVMMMMTGKWPSEDGSLLPCWRTIMMNAMMRMVTTLMNVTVMMVMMIVTGK